MESEIRGMFPGLITSFESSVGITAIVQALDACDLDEDQARALLEKNLKKKSKNSKKFSKKNSKIDENDANLEGKGVKGQEMEMGSLGEEVRGAIGKGKIVNNNVEKCKKIANGQEDVENRTKGIVEKGKNANLEFDGNDNGIVGNGKRIVQSQENVEIGNGSNEVFKNSKNENLEIDGNDDGIVGNGKNGNEINGLIGNGMKIANGQDAVNGNENDGMVGNNNKNVGESKEIVGNGNNFDDDQNVANVNKIENVNKRNGEKVDGNLKNAEDGEVKNVHYKDVKIKNNDSTRKNNPKCAMIETSNENPNRGNRIKRSKYDEDDDDEEEESIESDSDDEFLDDEENESPSKNIPVLVPGTTVDKILARVVGRPSSTKVVAAHEFLNDERTDEDYYLVKLANAGYRFSKWVSKSKLLECESRRLRAFDVKFPIAVASPPYFPDDFSRIERVVASKGQDEHTEVLIKWKSLEYDQCTWESGTKLSTSGSAEQIDLFLQALEKFQTRINRVDEISTLKSSRISAEKREPLTTKDEMPVYEPEFPNGLDLRSYQHEGLDWLRFSWLCRRSVILADEMGLGKTAQSISFLQYLRVAQGLSRGPFLVVAPRSCVDQWQREIERWTDMYVVLFVGSQKSRELVKQFEFWKKDRRQGLEFDILVTSYETVETEMSLLEQVPWVYSIIDEGHRLKNDESQTFKNMQRLNRGTGKLLLTGTPIQNDMGELWALLNFLHPERAQFSDKIRFVEQFGDMTDAAEARALHRIIAPFVLRREKGDVEASMPSLSETIVFVELTPFQKRCYRAIYESNAASLVQGMNTRSKPNLVSMQSALRLCCGHPFLVNGVEEAEVRRVATKEPESVKVKLLRCVENNEYEVTADMVASYSGKLVLLDKLLPKLQREGHRVLIFSFFKLMINEVEFVVKHRGFTYERLDGDVIGAERQRAMDRFNRPEGAFCFLLTTRAGGVGLNLQSADTVIMLDSDWNPQNDLQAKARCHRIGQTKNVQVYRLITKNTYEEVIFNRANRKLGLERAVNAGGLNGPPKEDGEIERLLRLGAVVLADDDSSGKQFCEADIDEILLKSSVTTTKDQQASGGSLSIASFVSNVDENDPNFWDKVGLAGFAAAAETDALNGMDCVTGDGTIAGSRPVRSVRGGIERQTSLSGDAVLSTADGGDELAEATAAAAASKLPKKKKKEALTVSIEDEFDLPEFAVLNVPNTDKFNLNVVERRAFERSLLTFGVHRVGIAMEKCGLGGKSPEVFVSFVLSFLNTLLGSVNSVDEQEALREMSSLVNLQFPALNIATPVKFDAFDEFDAIRYLKCASKMIKRFRGLKFMCDEIARWEADGGAPFQGEPLPMDWWNSALETFHDRSSAVPAMLTKFKFRAPACPRKLKGCAFWNVNSDQDSLLLLHVYENGWTGDFVSCREDGSFFQRVLILEDLFDMPEEGEEEGDKRPSLAKVENIALSDRLRVLIGALEKEAQKRTAEYKEQEQKRAMRDKISALRLKQVAEKERDAKIKRAASSDNALEATNRKRVDMKKNNDGGWSKSEVEMFFRQYFTIGEKFIPELKIVTFDDMAAKFTLKTQSQVEEFYHAACARASKLLTNGDPIMSELLRGEIGDDDLVEYDHLETLHGKLDSIFARQFGKVVRTRTNIRKLFMAVYDKNRSVMVLQARDKASRPKAIPAWWVADKHDEAVVRGAIKYGVGDANWERVWNDGLLGFRGLDSGFDYEKGKARNLTFYPKPDVCVSLLECIAKENGF